MKSYEQRIDSIFRKYEIQKTLNKRRNATIKRSAVSSGACAAVLLGINQFSLSAYGENVFSRVYHFTKGGISIMVGEENSTEPETPPVTEAVPTAPSAAPTEREVMELPTAPGDPYGIKAVCAKYGIYPMTPSYIPEGFELVEMYEDATGHCIDIMLRYVKGEESINICYTLYNINNVSIAIPMESRDIQECVINGQVFSVIKEDNQLKAFSIDDKLMCSVITFNIDYSEADKILYSFH